MRYDGLNIKHNLNPNKVTKILLAILLFPVSLVVFVIGVLLLWALLLTVPFNDCDFEKGAFAKVEKNIVEAPCNIIYWACTHSEHHQDTNIDLQVIQ